MENLLISTGAVVGIALGGYLAGSTISDDGSLIALFIGAMIGAATGGWVTSRLIDRLE